MVHGRTSPLSTVIVERSDRSSSSSNKCADDFDEVPEQLDQQLDKKLTKEHLDRSALIVVDPEGAHIDVNLIGTLKLSPDLHTHACNVANKLAQEARTALVEVQVPAGGAVLPAVLPAVPPGAVPAGALSSCSWGTVARTAVLPALGGGVCLAAGFGLRLATDQVVILGGIGLACGAGGSLVAVAAYRGMRYCFP